MLLTLSCFLFRKNSYTLFCSSCYTWRWYFQSVHNGCAGIPKNCSPGGITQESVYLVTSFWCYLHDTVVSWAASKIFYWEFNHNMVSWMPKGFTQVSFSSCAIGLDWCGDWMEEVGRRQSSLCTRLVVFSSMIWGSQILQRVLCQYSLLAFCSFYLQIVQPEIEMPKACDSGLLCHDYTATSLWTISSIRVSLCLADLLPSGCYILRELMVWRLV